MAMADREKIIDALEYLISGDCTDTQYDYMDEIEAAIELLKEQDADKWIPVTERLPEVRHAVLCYSPHDKNIWALSLHEDGEWYYWIPMSQKYNPDFEGPITHWMPPPEPPKEGR